MKDKRSGLVAEFAKWGALAFGAVALIAGIFVANRNPRESAIVLSSIPEKSVPVSAEYESSANPVNSEDPEKPDSDVTSENLLLINLNTASSRQLQTLSGIGEAKAAAIIEYRETHGGFFVVSELLNVSGIGEELYENIRDYVTVGDVPPRETPPESSAPAPVNTPPEIPIVNINTASLEELQKLPGIGSAKAMAIVQYRSVFGDFYDINEIKNVNGIGESTFEEIRDYITVGAVSPRPVQDDPQASGAPEEIYVNINTASLSELCKIPGIGNVKAQAIIDYREDHGDFYSIEEIKNVSGIGDKIFESIREYIYVEYSGRPGNDQNPDPVDDPVDNPAQNQPADPSYPVNLNTATLEELCTLPEISERMARDIIQFRIDRGGFNDIRELQHINGIGLDTIQRLRYIVTV